MIYSKSDVEKQFFFLVVVFLCGADRKGLLDGCFHFSVVDLLPKSFELTVFVFDALLVFERDFSEHIDELLRLLEHGPVFWGPNLTQRFLLALFFGHFHQRPVGFEVGVLLRHEVIQVQVRCYLLLRRPLSLLKV